MTKLSQRIAAMRQNFRRFEHGGHCFGSEEISAIVRELTAMRDAATDLERSGPAIPPPPPPRKEMHLGTLIFVPSAGLRLDN